MNEALIGLVGLLMGALLAEYFRRQGRIEIHSKEIFQKRLSIYEELYKTMNQIYNEANDVIENQGYSKEERKELWAENIFKLANFLDENSLYINEYISVHCMCSIIGVEDLYYENDKNKKKLISNFREDYTKTKAMIKEEAGLRAMEKLFGAISKPRYTSRHISYYKDMQERYAQKSKDTKGI
jgi:hypothetical protein